MADGDWRTGLAPELASHPAIANFKSVEDLTKSYLEAQKLVGVDMLPIPMADGKLKDLKDPMWGTVWGRLGRPEKADGYQIPEMKDLPEGFTIDPAEVTAFKTKAHELGITQAQAEGLFTHYATNRAGTFSSTLVGMEEKRVEAEKTLRVEWGAAYDANVSLAQKTLAFGLGKEDAEALGKAYGNDPKLIRLLAKLGNELSEDILPPNSPKPGDMTPAGAQAQIAEIQANKAHPYFDAAHPEHKAAVEKMSALFAAAHPGKGDQG